MFNTSKKIISFLDKKLQIEMAFIFVLILLSMLIETFSIGLIIPLVTILFESNVVEEYPNISNFVSKLSPTHFFLPDKDDLSYPHIVGGGIFIFFIVYFLKAIYLFFFTIIKANFIFKLRCKISEKFTFGYLKLPFSYFSEKNSAILTRNIINENLTLADVTDFFLTVLTELLVLIGILSLLIIVNPTSAFILFVILGIASYFFWKFTQQKLFDYGVLRKTSEENRLKSLNQIFGGIREIKAYNLENKFVSYFLEDSTKVFKSYKWLNLFNSFPRIWFELVGVFSLTVLIIAMIIRVDTQIAIVATLSLLAGAVFRLLPSVNRVMGNIQRIRYYRPVINALHDELNLINKNKINNYEKVDFFKEIKFENIDFKYENSNRKILDKINLSIPASSFVGITGDSGVGKSTLANLLIGLLQPTKGKIFIDNKEIKGRFNWQKKIGYVPQQVFLIDDTISRNIAFGLTEEKINESKIFKVIKSAQLEKTIQNLPNGLNTIVGERGFKLSGGELQRIGIARALYNDPNILVFDEATSALDLDTEKEFMEIVNILSKNKTLFMISHKPRVLKFCDVIYNLKQGKLNKVNFN